MITEDYVSFETAKLLKEKGFDKPCEVWYAEYTSVWGGDTSGDRKYINIQFDDKNRFDEYYKFLCYAPTLQMAMKWLREVHNKHCHVSFDYVLGWYIQIVDTKETTHTYDDEEMKIYHPEQDCGFNSYEEACEAAIKYCLENLIT